MDEKNKQTKKEINKKMDGWMNVFTGQGIRGKDKSTGAIVKENKLSQYTLEELYTADDIAGKIIDTIPNDGLRKGFELISTDKEKARLVMDELEKFDLTSKLEQAWKWARLYGGSAIILGVNDGKNLEDELDINNLDKLNSLTVLHRYELLADINSISKDLGSKNFGYPEMYTLISNREDNRVEKIHYTRLVRFDGVILPAQKFIKNNYWHNSVLVRLYNVIRNYNLAHDNLPNIVQEAVIGILKIKDIADMLASGEYDSILNRLLAFDLHKRVSKTAILDEEENYDLHSANLSGLDKIIDNINNRLVSASGMPHTIILGDSPTGGLSGKGESENRDYYDSVATQQKIFLKPKIDMIIKIYMLTKQGVTKGLELEDWDTKFYPLWELDEKEIVEMRKAQAETDKIYIETGVVDPIEVTQSRFEGEYSIETKLDERARRQQINNGE